MIAASKNNVLKIPADRIDAFTAAMVRHELANKVFATWQPYTLKPGETIEQVARRGGVTTAELLQANSISPRVKVLPGTRILAPLKEVEDESQVEEFAGARVYQLVNVPARYHVVKRRETSATIARRYGLTVSQLTAMNGSLTNLKPGARVMVRKATTQTVLVTENGRRQVIRRSSPVLVRASARPDSTDSSVRTVEADAPSKPAAKRPVKRGKTRSKTPASS